MVLALIYIRLLRYKDRRKDLCADDRASSLSTMMP